MTLLGLENQLKALGFEKKKSEKDGSTMFVAVCYKGKSLVISVGSYDVRMSWWHPIGRSFGKNYKIADEISDCEDIEALIDGFIEEMARYYGLEA